MVPPRASTEKLLADLADLGGAGLSVADLAAGSADAAPGAVRLGLDRAGRTPERDFDSYDLLLSADSDAPAPWVGVPAARLDGMVRDLQAACARQPTASAVLAQVLRTTLSVPFDQALALESLAYSMLLGSEGFRAWRARTPVRLRAGDEGQRVALSREAGTIRVRLTRSGARNAVDARMRDELALALQFALDEPDGLPVRLTGEGAAFSAGGDLDEFGQAADIAVAHLVRTLRSPATLAHRLGGRLTVELQGACIGAGVEIPASAGRVIARPDAFFRLPEVSMGLIPGAGGTASLPRRIGRHRTCFMALSGVDVDAATALAWGLVDAVEPTP